MATPACNYLFNFSSSYSGGGLVILKSYLELFEKHGGASFILNDKLKAELDGKYRNNKIYFVKIQKIKRLLDDEYYLKPIIKTNQKFDLYFAYGMPVYSKIAKVNWFHVSNLIPVSPEHGQLRGLSMLQMLLLGRRIKKNAVNLDVLSADSQDGVDQTLRFLSKKIPKTTVLRNGVSGEFIDKKSDNKDSSAITVGTQKYKDLVRLYNIFKILRDKGEVNELKVIGGLEDIPEELKQDSSVKLFGLVPHSKVIDELSKSKVYISTSRIENSSIASLEGLYLCKESFLSEIGSHKELIDDTGLDYESVDFHGEGKMYKVVEEVPADYIRSISWDNVNAEFYEYLTRNI